MASVMPLADAILIRNPREHPRALWELGLAVRRVVPNTPLWVNGPLEVALTLEAEGWHLPSKQVPASLLKHHWPGILSASAHTPEEVSWHHQANILVWGHAFPTRSKPDAPPRNNLAAVRLKAGAPILAIGGITAHTAPLLSGQGLSGVVVADGVWEAREPVEAAQRIRAALDAPEWIISAQ